MAKNGMKRSIVLLAAAALLFSSLARAEQGHPDRGRALFVGSVPFENGGAPCLACHGFAGLGLGGGANFGGDLTALWENFGEEGVVSILEDLSFPGMEPIFADRPLTDTERADLGAFFRSSTGGSSPDVLWVLGLSGFAVAGAGLVLAGLAGHRRLREVRRPLVKNANPTKGESP